jgi:protein TonB
VGGTLQAAKLIRRVEPSYPELALRSRIQGVVLLEVLVGAEGVVENVRLIRGHPLLNAAAVAAVSQWKYSPTLLNGEPVSVIATVKVRFVLN